MVKFLRTDSTRHHRIGRKRRKLQVWRRPTGRHNKIRKQRKSYPVAPTIGYRTQKKGRGLVSGFNPVLIHNVKSLNSLGKNSAIIIARIGAKNKLEIIKKAEEMKIKILNLPKGGKK